MENYMLRVLDSANRAIAIYVQTMEQHETLYIHKYCKIEHIRNVCVLISNFSM